MEHRKFAFRCDADKENGLGHLTRCLNIAREIRQTDTTCEVIFYGNFNEFAKQLLRRYSIHSANDNLAILENSALIIDHYDISANDVKAFKNTARKLVKIDDFNDSDLSDFDLVVNFRMGAEHFPYTVAPVCLGISYFPVKHELKAIRRKNLAKYSPEIHDAPGGSGGSEHIDPELKLNNILVFIGGTDHYEIASKLITLLDDVVHDMTIQLVTHDDLHETIALSRNHLKRLPFTRAIELYYDDADYVITGGGLAKYEAGYCCIPNAAISQNMGQDDDTKILTREGVTFDLGLARDLAQNTDAIKMRLVDFMSHELCKKMIDSMRDKYVANSSANLAGKILELSN